jgi:hypothetical protein
MSLSVGRAKLLTALKELRTRWDRVRRTWDDPVSREFEKEFIEPLDGKVRAGVSAMENMYELIIQARKDCEG